MTESLAVTPGDTVLLLAPTRGGTEPSIELFGSTHPEDLSVLFVTLTDSPEDRLAKWEAEIGVSPARAAFVYASNVADSDAIGDHDYEVTVVQNPANLTRLGVDIIEALDHLGEGDRQIAMCFHSLSVLLQYADSSQVFRFLRVLIDHLQNADVISHFHLDPSAHDEQTIATLRQLFDMVVEESESGEPQIVI